jgi:opacity protein-like surface antigen
MGKSLLAAVTLVVFISVVPAGAQRPGEPPRERLGARAAFAGTVTDLNDSFGNGYDFTLYFTEKIWRPVYLEIQIGATYLGDLLAPEVGERRTGIDEIASEMRLAYLTLGPQVASMVTETHTVYASLGLGIYTVSMLYDTGIQAFDESSQSLGMNCSLGLYWRISDNWNIEVNASASALQTGDDALYSWFTNNGRNPLLFGAGLGVAMDLR